MLFTVPQHVTRTLLRIKSNLRVDHYLENPCAVCDVQRSGCYFDNVSTRSLYSSYKISNSFRRWRIVEIVGGDYDSEVFWLLSMNGINELVSNLQNGMCKHLHTALEI